MSRSLRTLIAVLVVSFALGVTACADSTGPAHGCDYTSSNTCR